MRWTGFDILFFFAVKGVMDLVVSLLLNDSIRLLILEVERMS